MIDHNNEMEIVDVEAYEPDFWAGNVRDLRFRTPEGKTLKLKTANVLVPLLYGYPNISRIVASY